MFSLFFIPQNTLSAWLPSPKMFPKPSTCHSCSCTDLSSTWLTSIASFVEDSKLNHSEALVFHPGLHSSRGQTRLCLELGVYIALKHTFQQLAIHISQVKEGHFKESVNAIPVGFHVSSLIVSSREHSPVPVTPAR